ncbi:ABC transporter permease [Allonocardiopsis opalescens]|uniref:Xylose transport system permease protein XylH n=1 Tax=Allonocardiopsis opalescens TaxID=1144618 RepID=A0A2T0PVF8_9ACTN|nr:ABC transporter permease [Allonocardiopsis opalescens]PRX95420.1 monosaccharide ABC transporter membrane protein (CUT2 family) [Allonocardiopsis opalescens]
MTTTAPPADERTERRSDERVSDVGLLRRLLIRPELGAAIGVVVVFAFFAASSEVFRSPAGAANWLYPASTLGIMAIAVALLMIGGEFDLSAGVMTATVGLTVGLLSTELGWNLWAAMLGALVLALALGFVNGFLVVRTGLPSFIITLGMFLMLQGLNLGVTTAVTDTVLVDGIDDVPGYELANALLAGTVDIGGVQFRITILWWLVLTAVATWVLLRTRVGNWIFAVGGDARAARNVGVPAARTKIALFMTTAGAAWLVGTMSALRLTSVQANAGIGQELIFIVAAVIGGCLLTGGYGSAIGASLGALIFGMTSQGIVYLQWDANWFMFFLGAMLLLAVLANRLVRRYAEQSRK